MANTAASQISNDHICLNKGSDTVRCVNGTLASDCNPGTILFFDGDNQNWALADSSTAAHNLARIGVLGYRKRINESTGALRTIDDDYIAAEYDGKMAPIYISGIVVAKLEDPSASYPALTDLMLSDTVEHLEIIADAATGATSGTARKQEPVASLAANVITADVFAVIGLGKDYGAIWGGQNMDM